MVSSPKTCVTGSDDGYIAREFAGQAFKLPCKLTLAPEGLWPLSESLVHGVRLDELPQVSVVDQTNRAKDARYAYHARICW